MSPAIQELCLPLTCALPVSSPSAEPQAEEGTVVTPKVGAIAKRLFSQPLHIVEMSEDGRNISPLEVPSWPVHEGDPQVIKWGDRVEDSTFYQTVVLDGTTYRVCLPSHILHSI